MQPATHPQPVSLKEVTKIWWPLAASWLLMALELPALSAVTARLANPKINLAAYGGIVLPIALIIEAPIIMLLAASTALSKDWKSYQKIRKFMMVSSGLLTGIHIIIAFTPVYYFVVEKLIGAPSEIIEPGRVGLMIMLPWTWAIAYRRFNQGVLIRFGHSRSVGVGTLVRLGTNGIVLSIGFLRGDIDGIVVATSAVAIGVTCEAIYVGIKVKPVLKNELKPAPSVEPALNWHEFAKFYVPLALTSLMTLLTQPLISAALSRMPRALDSLAVWPVVFGLLFVIRSGGVAYNEVVVALLDKPRSTRTLRRFAAILTTTTSALLLIVTATPLSKFWFQDISALTPSLTALAKTALWFGLLLPGANTLQSWYQGAILQSKKTRGIPEAVALFLGITILMFGGGIIWGKVPGLYIGVTGFSLGMTLQTGWLWYRSRPAFKEVCLRDQAFDG
ncbi:MAG: hypothetical protein B6243_00765 [Anaerolineaceae bacterium 4572_5.2]|nr:MAG: hypothetical protein B6243_00765 [Anaerolineaceae bacterium 4572_5.2]